MRRLLRRSIRNMLCVSVAGPAGRSVGGASQCCNRFSTRNALPWVPTRPLLGYTQGLTLGKSVLRVRGSTGDAGWPLLGAQAAATASRSAIGRPR
eukprot:2863111-Pyramimonas_sp.AAC.1